jgi:hypothetical protein
MSRARRVRNLFYPGEPNDVRGSSPEPRARVGCRRRPRWISGLGAHRHGWPRDGPERIRPEPASGSRVNLPVENEGVLLPFERHLAGLVLFEAANVIDEEQPRRLFGVVEFGRAAGFFPKNVVDDLEGLFKLVGRGSSRPRLCSRIVLRRRPGPGGFRLLGLSSNRRSPGRTHPAS